MHPKNPIHITTLPGDGIGPEIMAATQEVLQATGAPLVFEPCVAGAKAFEQGITSGVPAETIASILKNKIVLKGPLETPIGYGGKSANVTLRKLCNTYGNIRPTRSIPGVITPFSDRFLNFTIIRENIEDLYAGIEYMQTPTVAQGLKIISSSGCERIVRLAFERAQAEGRKSLHCITKANIMKMTEGLMKKTFERIAPEYPSIQAIHMLVDNCAHQLVRHPERFEMIVCTNLHGDILSDLASGLVGGLGIAPSMNVGPDIAFFEAVHGSAPDIAGQNKANPTALLLSGILLLHHVGCQLAAERLEKALYRLLEAGEIRTGDLASPNGRVSSLSEFTQSLIHLLSDISLPAASAPIPAAEASTACSAPLRTEPTPAVLSPCSMIPPSPPLHAIGVDIFIQSSLAATTLGAALEKACQTTPFVLKNIANRGTQVYPVLGETCVDCVDCYGCRFLLSAQTPWNEELFLSFLRLLSAEFSWIHIEKLWEHDGQINYSLAQGEDK